METTTPMIATASIARAPAWNAARKMKSFPIKPASGGIPANEPKPTVSTPARNGLSFANPA